MKRKIIHVIVLIMICLSASVLVGIADVSAIDSTAILKKSLAYDLKECYKNGGFVNRTDKEFAVDQIPTLDDLLTQKGKENTEENRKNYLLPNQIGNSAKEANIYCKGILDGWGTDVKGLFALTGKTYDAEAVKGLGFIKYNTDTSDTTGKKCLSLMYGDGDETGTFKSEGESNRICYNVNSDGTFSYDPSSGKDRASSVFNIDTGDGLNFAFGGSIGKYKAAVQCSSSNNFDDFVNNCWKNRNKMLETIYADNSAKVLRFSSVTEGGVTANKSKWVRASSNGDAALKYFGITDINFSDQEKYDILQTYVDAIRSKYGSSGNITVDLDKCHSRTSEVPSGAYAIPNRDGDGWKWCEITVSNDILDEKFNIAKGSFGTDSAGLRSVTFKTVLTEILKTPDGVDLNGSNVVEVDTPGSDEAEPDCMNSGAGTSLGWIVCPVLKLLTDASQSMYNEFVEPALQVDPVLFRGNLNDGTESGVRQAWGIFRDIANVVFVILFIVVIFSQLTGVGIDNYGIKKILPKLIVAAVLINLSYIICLIAIDLSNILGNGLQAMFNGLASGFTIPVSNEGYITIGGEVIRSGVTAESVGTTAITGAAILGIVATGIWAAVKTSGGTVATTILLMLLVTAITIVFSIFFLFVLLGAREAAIIVLTVISPLAFACMILPNTKSLFDKWWKFGKVLLLVYPICGLLVGGGNFVSKLLLSVGAANTGFFSAFIAMIVGVVPIFFIPTVLKNAIAAMGTIGGKLSGLMAYGKSMGQKVGGNARNTITGSNRYKSWANDVERDRKLKYARKVAGKYYNADGTVKAEYDNGNGGIRDDVLNKRQARRVTSALAMQIGEQKEEGRRGNLLQGGARAEMAGIESGLDDERVKNEEALIMNDAGLRDNNGLLQAGLESALVNNDSNKIRAYQNVLSRKGEDGREAVRSAMVNALASGNVNDAAKQTYASNMVNKWGMDYKNNNRSTFNFANSVLGGNTTATLDNSQGTAVNSLKQSTLSTMDEKELLRTIDATEQAALNNPNDQVAQDNWNNLQNLMYDSLQNEAVRNNMKESVRQEFEKHASTSQKAQAAQAAEAQAQADQQARDQSVLDVRAEIQNMAAQSQTNAQQRQNEVVQDMGRYELNQVIPGQNNNPVHIQLRRDGTYAVNGQKVDISKYRKIK